MGWYNFLYKVIFGILIILRLIKCVENVKFIHFSIWPINSPQKLNTYIYIPTSYIYYLTRLNVNLI